VYSKQTPPFTARPRKLFIASARAHYCCLLAGPWADKKQETRAGSSCQCLSHPILPRRLGAELRAAGRFRAKPLLGLMYIVRSANNHLVFIEKSISDYKHWAFVVLSKDGIEDFRCLVKTIKGWIPFSYCCPTNRQT